MFQWKKKTLSVIVAMLIGASGPAFAAAGEQNSDTWTKAKLVTTYTLNRHLNPFDIDVDVQKGVVTLRGKVESSVERDLATELARSIEGVREVRNELAIDPNSAGQARDQSFTSKVNDANITAKVKSQLLWNRNTHGMNIDVDTRGGVVTLNGTVKSSSESELAELIARNTSDVAKVNNQLKIDSKTASTSDKAANTARSVEQNISDTWITTKVKSALLYNRFIDSEDIKVETRNGVVYLKGTVEDRHQKDQALSVTRDIRGVKDVKAELKLEGRS